MMDELDGLFSQRTQNERSDYNNGLVNTLLSLLDGIEVNNDVFVIGLKFTYVFIKLIHSNLVCTFMKFTSKLLCSNNNNLLLN